MMMNLMKSLDLKWLKKTCLYIATLIQTREELHRGSRIGLDLLGCRAKKLIKGKGTWEFADLKGAMSPSKYLRGRLWTVRRDWYTKIVLQRTLSILTNVKWIIARGRVGLSLLVWMKKRTPLNWQTNMRS